MEVWSRWVIVSRWEVGSSLVLKLGIVDRYEVLLIWGRCEVGSLGGVNRSPWVILQDSMVYWLWL